MFETGAGAAYADLAEGARRVALEARAQARAMEERRAALSRSALVWWQGEAAERYELRVRERANALAELSSRLERVALAADAVVAAAAAARAAVGSGIPNGGGSQ